MSDGEKSSNAGLKIAIAVVLLAAAGYFTYANFFAGKNSQPKTAAENLPQDVIDQNKQIEKEIEELPPEEIGGA
ncbi:MAG TPA: hypothetical protein ENJ00_04855 [Phycisphaerales bacterium]|nr:hypothetical protein [Phycisphaerales bacterium]